jgi:hypothetical protein
MAHLRAEGRTGEQIAALVAAAQSGYETALVIGKFFPLRKWFAGSRGPKSKKVTKPRRADKKEWPSPSGTTLLSTPGIVSGEFSPLSPFIADVNEGIAVTEKIIATAVAIDRFLTVNPLISEGLIHWKSPLQLAVGFAMFAAERAQMKRPTPREMSALLLVVGDHNLQRDVDDAEATEDAVNAAKRMMSRVSKQVLPGLRAMTTALPATK